MWPFSSRPSPAQSYLDKLDELQTRVERLELDSADRQVAVLNAIEKTMTQLRARVAKRERDSASQDDPGSTNGEPEVVEGQRFRPNTVHLAQRFRRY